MDSVKYCHLILHTNLRETRLCRIPVLKALRVGIFESRPTLLRIYYASNFFKLYIYLPVCAVWACLLLVCAVWAYLLLVCAVWAYLMPVCAVLANLLCAAWACLLPVCSVWAYLLPVCAVCAYLRLCVQYRPICCL
jgi:hypothetical protein